MNCVAYSPKGKVFGLSSDIDRIFGQHFDNIRPYGRLDQVRMDITEDENSFKIIADLPGMEKDKIKIIVEDDILSISGERVAGTDTQGDRVWSERFDGNFSRSFRLGDSIDASGMSADYKNGILVVTLPKKAEAKPRTIEIKVE